MAVVLLCATWIATNPVEAVVMESPIAEIIGPVEIDWSEGSAKPANKRLLYPGEYALAKGRLRILMKSGAVLCLTGPSEFRLVDAKAVQVDYGKLTADIPQSAVGFHVLTPTGDVVDLGTEFGIAIDEDGSTEIHVQKGIVVARAFAEESIIPILAKEAGRIDAFMGGVSSIPFNQRLFAREAAEESEVARRRWGGQPSYAPLPAGSRIVYLGDNNLAEEAHLLLTIAALQNLPHELRPEFFNSSLAYRLIYREQDFQRFVEPYRPTHAVLGFNSETAMRTHPTMTPKKFEEYLRIQIQKLTHRGIEPILTIGYELAPEQEADKVQRGHAFNDVVLSLAKKYGCRVANFDVTFSAALKSGTAAVRLKGGKSLSYEPTFEGQRCIAKAMLAAFGYPNLSVPESLSPDLLPGVITSWRFRFGKQFDPILTAEQVAGLEVDQTFEQLTIPQAEDRFTSRYSDPGKSMKWVNRQRGFLTHLHRPKNRFGGVGVATINSPVEREVYLNVGANLRAIWVNGERMDSTYEHFLGSYAGRERIPVVLREGENEIVIQTGSSFFLSVTDERDWPMTY